MKGRSYETKAERLAGAPAEAHPRRQRVRSLRQDARGTPALSCPRSGRAAKSGRAALFVLAGIAALALFGWIAFQRAEGPANAPLEPVATGSEATGGPATALSPSERDPELWDPPKPYERARPTQPSFDGRGSIRGLVQPPPGVPLPKAYTVNVGPSTSLAGRERAEHRSLEVGAAEFAIEDLPLGGYEVWITAPGLNSRRSPILLTEASAHPYIVLKISPMGSLDGFVVRADGGPAEDLRVELAERDGEGRLEARTRADGYYRFEHVPDGEYRIRFGPLHGALLPEREVAFLAPSLRFPKVELPPTAVILIHTTDVQGRALGEVTLTGFGKPSGRIEATSDLSGNAWVHNLPPGRYRLSGTDAEGRRGKTTLEVQDEASQEFWISVR